ncbi:B9 domain-containing protein 1 [Chionoecetes opilio]|uniref:B9 domain-containing protein 1 n=1 Tax=Chionoecetes opilio TaxID=41210 RepID=A0A8J4XYW3_CHIOP|nr:B9 domain-containing protein 1 [Chionoecetes opilio]
MLEELRARKYSPKGLLPRSASKGDAQTIFSLATDREGVEECVSQTACRSDDERQRFVWNFPIDITYNQQTLLANLWDMVKKDLQGKDVSSITKLEKAIRPQIILSVYGTDFFGNIVIVGYAGCHVPLTPGTHTRRNISETIEHFLLQCLRFHSHRVVLRSQLLTLNVATCDLPTLLAAAGVHPSRQHAVICLTCAFLRKTGQLQRL